jgi:hypothetical protein
MGLVVLNTKFLRDHHPDPGTGPYRPAKPIGFGALSQIFQQAILFGWAQPGRSPGVRPREQSLGTRQVRSLDPLTYRPFADGQGLGDVLLGPTLLREFQRAEAPRLLPIGI